MFSVWLLHKHAGSTNTFSLLQAKKVFEIDKQNVMFVVVDKRTSMLDKQKLQCLSSYAFQFGPGITLQIYIKKPTRNFPVH